MKRLLSLLILVAAITRLAAAPATALAFSPDNAALASGAYRKIELRSIPSGKITEQISCELPRISSISFSSNGTYLAVAGGTPGENGVTLILDWNSKKVRYRFTNFSDLVTSAGFNSEATWLAVGSADSTAMLCPLDSTSTKTPITLHGHSGPVLGIAWSPQNDFLVTASADRSLKVWSAADGKLLRSFSHHTEPVHAVVFRPRVNSQDESPFQCASGSDDGTVRIWQPTIGRMVRIIRGHDSPVFALAYTPDGRNLYSAGKGGIIRRLDPDSDQILGQWQAHDEPIYRLSISPDGNHLASGDWSGKVRLWELNSGGLLVNP